MPNSSINRHRFYLDIPLLLLIMCLMAISLVVLFSVGGTDKMLSQMVRFGVGFVVLFIVLFIPKGLIRFSAPAFYLLTIILLVAVEFYGANVNNSQRWLNIGVTKIQPSEIAKIAIPLMLATYFYSKRLPPTWKDIFISLMIIIVPTVLVFKQPDLGTAILVASSGCVLLFLAGISWRLITSAFVLLTVSIPLFWFYGMKDYQKTRVMTVLNPELDPIGDGYNIIQSQIAIGSGGMHGKGFQQGVQSAEFLPENTTDFIFAVFSEEWGLMGIAVLFTIYLLIILRCSQLTLRMTDNFSRLLSGSLIFIFFIYFFINVGMVSGILPVVGLPLPMISYGGTSILTIMLSFGLIMNLYGTRKVEHKEIK